MHWISIILIGLASNIDNLGIGVSFGTRSIRIPILSNLLIAILGMTAAYLSITMGNLISGYMSRQNADMIGGMILMALGAWSMRPKGAVPAGAIPSSASEESTVISWKESVSLGLALSLNGFAMGFGAGVSGVSPIMAAISVGLFSMVTVAIGERIGHQIARTWLGKYSNAVGGLLLIAIGFYEIFI